VISNRDRILLVLMAMGVLALLVAVSLVEPDHRRLGTHQKFGFPPCTFRALFDKPCPSCGMTTAWAHLVRGELADALLANVGGTILAVLAVAAVPWLIVSAWRGRWLLWTPGGRIMACGASLIMLITLVDWVFRLVGK